MSATPWRLPYLDGIRGIAILLVFVGHLLAGVYPWNRPFFDGYRVLLGTSAISGVQLFFVLSGYLITSLLVREYSSTGRVSIVAFYIRRFFRIMPPLALLCSIFGALALILWSWNELPMALGSILRSITFTTNLPVPFLGLPDSGWLSHTWSLSVEEQFYLILPVVLALTLRSFRSATPIVLGAAILLICCYRASYMPTLDEHLIRWDASLWGSLAALGRKDLSKTTVILALSAFGLLTITTPPLELVNLYFISTAISAAVFIRGGAALAWLEHRILIYFGKISYNLYLWHLLVMRFGLPGYMNLVISVIISHYAYNFVDLRFIKLGHALSDKWRHRSNKSTMLGH